MKGHHEVARPVDLIADELRLQAWLARKEFENPSLRQPETYERLSMLAEIRDEIRLQLHLGKMEHRDDWHELEERWRGLMDLAADTREEVADRIEDTISTLEKAYKFIRYGHQ